MAIYSRNICICYEQAKEGTRAASLDLEQPWEGRAMGRLDRSKDPKWVSRFDEHPGKALVIASVPGVPFVSGHRNSQLGTGEYPMGSRGSMRTPLPIGLPCAIRCRPWPARRYLFQHWLPYMWNNRMQLQSIRQEAKKSSPGGIRIQAALPLPLMHWGFVCCFIFFAWVCRKQLSILQLPPSMMRVFLLPWQQRRRELATGRKAFRLQGIGMIMYD